MISTLGDWGLKKLKNFFYAAGFMLKVLREVTNITGRNKIGFNVLVMQILFTGVNALGIIAIFSLALGAVIIVQGSSILQQLGQRDFLYPILISVITREGGPLLTALVVMSRSGVAIATELGNMVVKHEIEAYISVGIDPFNYLLVPRLLGVTISTMLLTIYFNLMGLGASFIFAQLLAPIPFSEYFRNLMINLSLNDLIISLVKSFFFGVIIALVSSYNGLSVQNATTEIPVITIKAVGQGFALIFLFNVILTLVRF